MHRISDIHASDSPFVRIRGLGPAALSAGELLGIVLDLEDWSIAERMLLENGGLAGLARMEPGAVTAWTENDNATDRMTAAFELGKRLLADWPTGRWTIRGPIDLADRLILQMGRLENEELRVVVLDTKNHVLKVETVYQGNVSSTLVRVGELFRTAVRLNAAGIILVHNHPSGDPTPSPDDLHMTAEALAAGRLLDIHVLDHLVIGHDTYASLRDRGVIFDRPSRSDNA